MTTNIENKLNELKEIVRNIDQLKVDEQSMFEQLLQVGYDFSTSYLKMYEEIRANKNLFMISQVKKKNLSLVERITVSVLRATFNAENIGYDAFTSKHSTFRGLVSETLNLLRDVESERESLHIFGELFDEYLVKTNVIRGIFNFYITNGTTLKAEHVFLLRGLRDFEISDIEKLDYLIKNFDLRVARHNGNDKVCSELKEFRKALYSAFALFYLTDASTDWAELEDLNHEFLTNNQLWKWNQILKSKVEDGAIELAKLKFE